MKTPLPVLWIVLAALALVGAGVAASAWVWPGWAQPTYQAVPRQDIPWLDPAYRPSPPPLGTLQAGPGATK